MEARWYQREAIEALFNFYGENRKIGQDGKPLAKNALIQMPTGTGKSLVIADFLRQAFAQYAGTRAIMATHVKSLIEQNAGKLLEAWPTAPMGINSAGLNQRDFMHPIIYGGIKSMVGKRCFGHRDFLVIDECHLVNDEGMYLEFINELKEANPYLKIIGLSATGYRHKMGSLTNGKIFTDVVYDACKPEMFNRLIAEGFLCMLVPKRGSLELDVSTLSVVHGDYKQADIERETKRQKITFAAIQETVLLGQDRKSWLIFASSIEDAEEICTYLDAHGISNVIVHSKRSKKQNADAEKKWKNGEVKCAVNMGMFTTGIDHPALDLISVLRPTMSTVLWVQMLGRGTRPFPGKQNCLVLDYAGNTRRLGQINDPVLPRFKEKQTGDAPVRICENCNSYNHASARVCIVCGEEFTFEVKIKPKAFTDELVSGAEQVVETFKVDRVIYKPHTSAAGKSSIRVVYYSGLHTFFEWVSVEGKWGQIKGRNWFRQRYKGEPPATDAEVLALWRDLRKPTSIRVWVNHKPYPEILAAEF